MTAIRVLKFEYKLSSSINFSGNEEIEHSCTSLSMYSQIKSNKIEAQMEIILPLKVKVQIFQVKSRSTFLFCSVLLESFSTRSLGRDTAVSICYWMQHSSFRAVNLNQKSLMSLIFFSKFLRLTKTYKIITALASSSVKFGM